MIIISEEANLYIKKKLNNNLGVLVEVVKGGCFGVRYSFSYIDYTPSDAEQVKFESFSIFIKNNSLLYVIGSRLECIKDSTGIKLAFVNPNAKKTCGCNNSFFI